MASEPAQVAMIHHNERHLITSMGMYSSQKPCVVDDKIETAQKNLFEQCMLRSQIVASQVKANEIKRELQKVAEFNRELRRSLERSEKTINDIQDAIGSADE